MLYIILIVIAIILFLIYRGQRTPKTLSRKETMEAMEAEIERSETVLLERMDKTHLRKHMQTEKILFDCGRKNFMRIKERYTHDDAKLDHAITDWIDYMDALNSVISDSEMIDVASSNEEVDDRWESRDESIVKIQEINKRFKELLTAEYIDPAPLLEEEEKIPLATKLARS